MKSFASLIAEFLLVLALAVASPALAAPSLEQAVSERMTRVTEFQFIRKEAEKLGVRVWLFGGTAAGFGHYVKWDLLRESGDRRFQPNRFDYDYTNIYRSTQDLDVVIDGTAEQVAALQEKLEKTFPHFQGSRSAWEVRSLRHKIADKEALLNNPDFLQQHTDSNSTGMIEITKPPKDEPVIRDLRAWSDPNPAFLTDLKADKLHYYFSPSHFSTSRAKDGLNPPILSALRYLTKAFQYELEIDPSSLAHLKKIIAEFDPQKDLATTYAQNQLEKNAKKMVQHAVNLEYARDWLDRLGLREKLILLGDVNKEDSMAWWLNKMPLKTSAVGVGKGKTAAEIAKREKWPLGPKGEIIVAHETNNFLAYESITRAHTGDPNVLISRAGFEGEAAAHGDGFYTQVGREGARGTGLTIRFELDPSAREGTDFTVSNNYVVVKNKKAIRVIPESLNLDPVSYFRFLLNAEGVDDSDKALMEKLGRRMRAQMPVLGPETLKSIQRMVLKEFKKNGLSNSAFFSEWFRIPESVRLSREMMEAVQSKPAERISLLSLQRGNVHWDEHPSMRSLTLPEVFRGLSEMKFDYKKENFIESLVLRFSDPKKIPPADLQAAKEIMLQHIRGGQIGGFVDLPTRHWFSLPWAFDSQVSEVAVAMKTKKELHEFILSQLVRQNRLEFMRAHPGLLEDAPEWALAKAVRDAGQKLSAETLNFILDADPKKTVDSRVAENLEHLAKTQKVESLVNRLIERGAADREIAKQIAFIPEAGAHPEWVDTILARGKAYDELVTWLLPRTEVWKPNPKWMTTLLQKTRDFKNHDIDAQFLRSLTRPEWRAQPEWRSWIGVLVATEHPTYGLFRDNLLRPADIDTIVAKNSQYADKYLVGFLMNEINSKDSPPEFRDHAWVRARLDKIVQHGSAEGDIAILQEVMSDPKWAKETGWVEQIIKRGKADYALAEHVLSQPYSAAHPEWLGALLSRGSEQGELGSLDELIDQHVLSKPHWKNHPEVKEAMGGKALTASDLRMKFRKPGDPGPLFQNALKLARAYRGKHPWEALKSYSTEDLKTLALASINSDHPDSETMERLRGFAQRNLLERKDPRLAQWLREDFMRTRDNGRLDLLTGVGVSDPAVEKVVQDFWREIQPADTKEKQTARNFLLRELGETVTAKNTSMIPIALKALETPGDEMHSVRWDGMQMLSKIDLKQEPELRRVLMGALSDKSEYIRGNAIAQLERMGESSPAYVAKIRDMAAKENNFFVTKDLMPAAERVAKLASCSAGFAAISSAKHSTP